MRIFRSAVFLAFMFFPLLFSSTETAYAQEPLTFSILPYRIERDLRASFTPLANYLSKKIGRPIKVVIARSYEEQIEMMGKNKMDFCFTGPVPYLRIVDTYGKKTILGRLETNGKPTFHGVIFVAKDSPLRSLADLKGKRFAFGDPNSTMSHVVPVYLLWKAGVTIDALGGHAFLGKHENVALGVLSGDFDAGAMISDIFSQYEKRGLKMLMRTPEYSGLLLVARNRLSLKTARVLREALFGLKNSEEGRVILANLGANTTGIVPAEDKDYDNLREALTQLEKIGAK